MTVVLIAAAREDRKRLKLVEEELKRRGLVPRPSVWEGKDTRTIDALLASDIGSCAAFVPIVSSDSAGCEWLQGEVEWAIGRGRPIYPLKVGGCTFQGRLRFMQYEWFNDRPSTEWFDRLAGLCGPNAIAPSRIVRGHTEAIWAMAQQPGSSEFDAGSFVTGGWDNTARVWTGNELRDGFSDRNNAISFDDRVLALAFHPKGSEIAIGCEDGPIRIWSMSEKEVVFVHKGHGAAVRSLAYSPNGDTLFSASVDRTVRVWQRRPAQVEHVFRREHTKNVLGVACSPLDNSFASVSEDGRVLVWNNNPRDGPPIVLEGHGDRPPHDKTVWGVAYSPTAANQLASVGRDMTVRIWDLDDPGRRPETLEGHTGSVICVAYSPDGRYLATGSADETVRLWEIATGKSVATLWGHCDAVRAVAFRPGGGLLSASADATVMYWPLPWASR